MKKINSITFLLATTFSFTMATAAMGAPDNFSAQQRNEIDQRVHDYLINHPEILREVANLLDAKTQAQAQKLVLKAIKDNKQEVFNDSNIPSYSTGKGKPGVILVEFFDYQCIHCQNMALAIADLLKSDKKLKVSFREFPIFGADSEYIAKAALASVKQGKYYELHTALFAADVKLNKEAVDKIAKSVGLNVDQLHKDMEGQGDALKRNWKLAERLGLPVATPAFIVGGKMVSGIPTQFVFIPGEIPKEKLQSVIKSLE